MVIEADPEKAVYWYMKSAEGGDVTAKGNLGECLAECYEHGVGGRSGRRLALFHYQEAADFGSKRARETLKHIEART